MEIPDCYKGNQIISFLQRENGSIAMMSGYELKDSELYEADKSEEQDRGNSVIGEFKGVNGDFHAKASGCFEKIDRTRRYKPGEIDLGFVVGNI